MQTHIPFLLEPSYGTPRDNLPLVVLLIPRIVQRRNTKIHRQRDGFQSSPILRAEEEFLTSIAVPRYQAEILNLPSQPLLSIPQAMKSLRSQIGNLYLLTGGLLQVSQTRKYRVRQESFKAEVAPLKDEKKEASTPTLEAVKEAEQVPAPSTPPTLAPPTVTPVAADTK